MTYESTAIIGAIILFYFGKCFIEINYENYVAKYIFRVLGSILMTCGCWGWLAPIQPVALSTSIILAMIVAIFMGLLMAMQKEYSERIATFALTMVLTGVIFDGSQLVSCVLLSMFMILSTYYEYKREQKS